MFEYDISGHIIARTNNYESATSFFLGIEGSDYFNASYIDGYRYRNAYIATQGPLNETVEDFWRMLWEHNSTIVVMLTKQREMGCVSISHWVIS